MNRFLLVIAVLVTFVSYSQVVIKSSDPNFSDDSELHQLDSAFQNLRVVCAGESTHGTHEFFTMRHRLFKYLVENHGFNTFFLEADFGACLSANRYIHGEHDDIEEAITNIRLWPWITDEMVDLLVWMRSYNMEHKNQLSFLGCDVQFFNDAQRELDLIIQKYSTDLIDTTMRLEKSNYYKSTISSDSLFVRLIINHKEKILSKLNFTGEDKSNAYALIKNMKQVVTNKEAKEYWKRDYLMGLNIENYLNNNPNDKVFYWAHNGHIVNNLCIDKKGDTITCSAGSIVKESFEAKCLIVLQDFHEGSFNSLIRRDIETDSIQQMFEMKENQVYYFPKKLTANQFLENGKTIMWTYSNNLNKKVYIRSIGALYSPQFKARKAYIRIIEQSTFDAMIFHYDTTPTKLKSKKK